MHEAIGKRTTRPRTVPGLVAIDPARRGPASLFVIEQGQPPSEDAGRALNFGPGLPLDATTGQLEVAHFGGLDIWATVGDNLRWRWTTMAPTPSLNERRPREARCQSVRGLLRYEPDAVARAGAA